MEQIKSFKENLILIFEKNGTNNELDNLLYEYIAKGVSRNEVFNAINDMFLLEASMLNKNSNLQDQFDYLGEILTAITGYCAPNCILRFRNDPIEDGEFISFVRGNKWKH